MTTSREQLREKLLSRGKGRRYDTVKMPDGEEYTIRDLSPREAMQQKLLVLDKDGEVDMTKLAEVNMRLVATCVVDPQTKENLLEPDEWEMLDEWSDPDFEHLHSACLKHCELDEEALVKGQAKNSD